MDPNSGTDQQDQQNNQPNGEQVLGNPADDNGNPDPTQNPGHPAWQEILDVLPDSLHDIVTPTLKKWDEGVQKRFEELHQQYNPYKPLVQNNIDPNYIEQALMLANQFAQNPEEVVQRAIDHYNLEQFKASQQQYDNEDEEEFVDLDMVDNVDELRKDPRFREFFERQDQLAEWVEQQQAQQEESQASQQLQQYLDGLHNQYGHFDDLYVSALLANGIDGEVAVKQFQDTVNQAAQALAGNQQQQTQAPPVVMGASGTTGSGLPDNPVKFGEMQSKDVNDLVLQYLQQSNSDS